MKKIIFFALFVNSLFSVAQILNPGFESATSNKPDNYNEGFYSTYFIQDTTDAHGGSQAAFIKAFGAQSYSVQGAVLGLFTISGKPASLTGWYKCNLQPGDSLVFSPYVYETTVFSADAQAYAFTTTSTAVYKQFTAPFNYAAFTATSVANLFVSIYLSGQSTDGEGVFIPKSGTWAMIDDLVLEDFVTTGIQENSNTVNIEKVYPLPASNMAYLIYTLPQTASCSLQLLDITGKEVRSVLSNEKQTPGRYKAEIDMSNLAPGLYFTRLTVNNEVRVSKIVHQ